MDAKTPPPPIPSKLPEKARAKKHERVADVSLPPLTSRQNEKSAINSWTRHTTYPTCYQSHNNKKRPYRVLQIGATPLMHACQQADRGRVLRLLREQEESIGYRDRTLRSALHYCMDAATGGAVASVAPELVNAPDAEGHTPLHLAVIAGDTQLVAVLLANGADVDAKDLEGHSVLHWATVCGEAECVRLILAAGARPSTADLRGGSPLHYAAQCCGAAANATVLAVPKKLGLKILRTLLEFGADVNAKDEDGRQPILWAASAGSVEAVLALARAGGAAAAGASDKDGLTALHCAASRGHVGCIEALVNLCGSQPDHVDDNGCSALHYAATLGHADATSLILRLGADPNRQDRKGRTPALCAAAKGQLETLKILAQHGGSLHARTVRGTGVAHEAVTSGRIELLEWLIKKRPSTLDVATQDGKTPLHVAALHGHLDVCKMLLDHGARINAILRTSKGNAMTALDAALYRGHRDCAKLIQMHGGTTAQRLRIHKIIPNQVFSAKVGIKRTTESSTDMESSSPRRRGYDYGYRRGSPRVYYEEERWIEKRTHRRKNSKKLSRRGSRSFSEEEIRSSKASLGKERQRRTRSESARYDDHEDDSYIDDKSTRKGKKKRTTKSKGDYSESSVEYSDESSRENIEEKEEDGATKTTYLRRKLERRRRSKCRARKGTRSEIGMRDREDCSRSEIRNVKDEHSGSDDSLEVIVVKTSVEKMHEKVVSGEKSKDPREDPDSIVRARKRTSKRKKSKSSGSTVATAEKEKVVTQRRTTSNNDIGSSEKKRERKAQCGVLADEEDSASFVRGRYHRDATDSTSHETVERVLVTAMVHKDGQVSDTPKSTATREIPKEVAVVGDAAVEETTSKSNDPTRKMDDDYEKPSDDDDDDDESSSANSLLSKIGCEGLYPRGDERNDGEETIAVEGQVAREGRLRVLEASEPRRTSMDSTTDGGIEFRKDSSFLKNKDKSDGQHHDTSPTDSLKKILITASNDGDSITSADSQMYRFSQSIEGDTQDTPLGDKTFVVSKAIKSNEVKQTAEESITTTTKEDAEENGNVVDRERDIALEEALVERASEMAIPDRKIVGVDKFDSTGKEDSPEASEFATRASSLFLTARVSDDDGIFEDKEQVDSARGKSVDLSSDSRDSASTMPGGEDGSSRINTPISTKRGVSEERSTTERKATRCRPDSREIVKTGATTANSFTNNDERVISSKDDASTPSATPRRSRRSRRCRSKNRSALAKIDTDAANKGSVVSSISCNKNKRLLDRKKQWGKRSTDRGAIVAVIEGPRWQEEEEDEEEIEQEIRKAIGEDVERDTEPEESNNEAGIVRVLPSTTSEEEPYRKQKETSNAITTLPEVKDRPCMHSGKVHSSPEEGRLGLRSKHRRDSCGGGGRDSGIEPSPRVSKIPKKRYLINYPQNTEKHEAVDIRDTVTRDVQISMRRYHLERKIFFQLMELKRLQIRHGRANEQVLVKRQVESFHKAGMSGPTLGVAKYDQPLTFRHFEAFLYEQLRKLQHRPATPNFCTDAKHCTQKTHRCHHATTAYTSVPVYTYRGDIQERGDVFPKIETRGRGRMTVEVSHGDEKRVIALPAERLDCTKRYFVTFTVTGGESQGTTTTTTTTASTTTTKPISSHSTKRDAAKSV